MYRSLRVFVVAAGVLLAARLVLAAEPIVDLYGQNPYALFSKSVSIRAAEASSHLCVVGGELRFKAFRSAEAIRALPPGRPQMPGKLPESSNFFVREASYLRVWADPEQRVRSKDLDAKYGWYLSGDYSTAPAQVVLTKEATKYSRWTFTDRDIRDKEEFLCHIKNENDLGKDAWLSLEEKGVFYGVVEIRTPVLSFDKKTRYNVQKQPASK